MKLFNSFPSLILSTLIACIGVESKLDLQVFDGSQSVITDNLPPVHGDNPLTYCNDYQDDDIVRIDYVNLTPNPPKIGQTLSIEVVGRVLSEIEQGAFAIVEVKYGLIKLLTTRIELCEQIEKADLKCPLKEGPVKIIKDVQLPAVIPPGTYNVYADAYTVDQEQITCLRAQVSF